MTDQRNRRFWQRVLIAFLIGVFVYFSYGVYAVIQVGESFKAGMD